MYCIFHPIDISSSNKIKKGKAMFSFFKWRGL